MILKDAGEDNGEAQASQQIRHYRYDDSRQDKLYDLIEIHTTHSFHDSPAMPGPSNFESCL